MMNKASGGDGIPAELFQILKDDTVNMLHSICQQIGKTQQWPQDQKRSVFIPIPKKGNAKNPQTATQLHSFHMLAKKCSKSFNCFIDSTKPFDCVVHNKLSKMFKEMRIPDHLSCLPENLYAGQEATVRTGHGTTDWFQLSLCLFKFYAEYIM